MSEFRASLSSTLAGKSLIGFDTSAWGLNADAHGRVAATAAARVGTKPPVEKFKTRSLATAKVGSKPEQAYTAFPIGSGRRL